MRLIGGTVMLLAFVFGGCAEGPSASNRRSADPTRSPRDGGPVKSMDDRNYDRVLPGAVDLALVASGTVQTPMPTVGGVTTAASSLPAPSLPAPSLPSATTAAPVAVGVTTQAVTTMIASTMTPASTLPPPITPEPSGAAPSGVAMCPKWPPLATDFPKVGMCTISGSPTTFACHVHACSELFPGATQELHCIETGGAATSPPRVFGASIDWATLCAGVDLTGVTGQADGNVSVSLSLADTAGPTGCPCCRGPLTGLPPANTPWDTDTSLYPQEVSFMSCGDPKAAIMASMPARKALCASHAAHNHYLAKSCLYQPQQYCWDAATKRYNLCAGAESSGGAEASGALGTARATDATVVPGH